MPPDVDVCAGERCYVADVPLDTLRDFVWKLVDDRARGWSPERAQKLMALMQDAEQPFVTGIREPGGRWINMSGGYRVQSEPVQLFDISDPSVSK